MERPFYALDKTKKYMSKKKELKKAFQKATDKLGLKKMEAEKAAKKLKAIKKSEANKKIIKKATAIAELKKEAVRKAAKKAIKAKKTYKKSA